MYQYWSQVKTTHVIIFLVTWETVQYEAAEFPFIPTYHWGQIMHTHQNCIISRIKSQHF